MTVSIIYNNDLIKFDFTRYAWPTSISERINLHHFKIKFYCDIPIEITIEYDQEIFVLSFSHSSKGLLTDFSYKSRHSTINRSYVITNKFKDFPAMSSEEKLWVKLQHNLDFSLIDMCKEGELRPSSLLKIRQKALRMGKEYLECKMITNHKTIKMATNWVNQNEELIQSNC